MSSVCIVGAMPPPVHGMAVVNAAIRAELEKSGTDVMTIDLSAASLDRGALVRARRMGTAFRGILRYVGALLRGETHTLYVGLSGGKGQVYELIFAVLARLFGRSVFLHHHSFAYLTSHSMLTSCLLRAAGPEATNIVLCARMGELLTGLYAPKGCVTPISNAAILEAVLTPTPQRHPLATLGFLANISKDKGIYEFLEVMDRARHERSPLHGRIAGPFADQVVEHAVRDACARNPAVEYVGPVYGQVKAAFLQTIDVLLFPTQYANEAEPLAILEALSHGVPVIARERGCISSMLARGAGLCVEQSEDFVKRALDQLTAWTNDAHAFAESRLEARRNFQSQKDRSEPSLRALCAEMASAPHDRVRSG